MTFQYFKPAPKLIPPIVVPPPPPSTELNHILITGQSNSTGSAARPLLSTTQQYTNKMFNTGVRAGSTGLTSFEPLVESSDVGGQGETIASAMTNFLSFHNYVNYPHLVSCHGRAGFRYSGLQKGTEPYQEGLTQVQAGKTIAQADSIAYSVSAVCNIHGESDQEFGVPNYGNNLATWQNNYDTDIKAITGQTKLVPMLACQQGAGSPAQAVENHGSQQLSTALELWKAHRANPDKIVLVGPRYQYDYIDGIHLTNHSQRWNGEQYGKVYKHAIVDGNIWRPLSPQSATINGTTIDITFYVPVPPLVLDVSMVVAPNNIAKGFEYWDNSGAIPAITNVQITGNNTIRITLASAPTGSDKQIRYAYTHTIPGAGRWIGARGNLRDSDSIQSPNGYPLYNWCVHFAWDLN